MKILQWGVSYVVDNMSMMSLTDNNLKSTNARSEVKMETNFPKIEALFHGVDILPTVLPLHISHA